MKQLFLFLTLLGAGFAADAANDVILSQRKADNSGSIQRNVAPVASGFLTFDASKVPTSPANITWVDPVFGVYGTSTNALRGIVSSQYSGGTDSAKFVGRKARGTATVPTVITTGDFLTRWTGSGYDGSNFIESASIVMGSTGTIAATRVPSYISFMTGTDAAPTVMTEAFRVAANQAIQVPSTNVNGLQLYNTADQVTNYERLNIFWSSNQATIQSTNAGSGSRRILRLQQIASGVDARIDLDSGNTTNRILFGSTDTSAANTFAVFQPGILSNTSGATGAVSILPRYNQASGTASNTDFLINRTQTAVGSGTQRLIDAQVGGVSMFSVSNTGAVVAAASINTNGDIAVLNGTGVFTTSGSGGRITGTGGALEFRTASNGTTLALTLSSSQSATFAGALITTPQALSGAGAINVTTSATFLTSTGVLDALTLANGTAGQIKYIVHQVDGGSAILTPTSKIGYTTITFTNVGDSVTLIYTAAGWSIVGIYGAVAA
jgi:hypothetical protein